MDKEELDVFIKMVENGGAIGGFSTSDFSIKQLVTLEKLQEKGLITVELGSVCVITVKTTE